MKRLWIVFLIAAILLCTGCDKTQPYRGEHDDLAATALHSIPGVISTEGDDYYILEEDEYGRVMFAVAFSSCLLRNEEWEVFPQLFAVVIMQKSDENNVFFYAEQNYLLAPYPYDLDQKTEKHVEEMFSEKQISKLKEANDWGKPPEKCSHSGVKISRDLNKDAKLSSKAGASLDSVIGSQNRWEEVLRRDVSGNVLCFVVKINGNHTKNKNYKWYAVVFDAKGNLQNGEESIMELTDINTFGQDIQKLLQQNDWKDATAP